MAEHAQMRLRHILESRSAPEGSPTDSENFRKLKAAYDACFNVPFLKELGAKPLEDLLHRLKDTYSAAIKSLNDSLTDSLLYLADLGIEALVASTTSVRQFSIASSFFFFIFLFFFFFG